MNRNLRTFLIVGLLALQAVAVLAIILLTSAAMRPSLVRQMDQQMSTSSETAVDNAEYVLQTTADSAELTQRALDTTLIDATDAADIEFFLRTELDANDKITGIYFGRPDGSFVLAQREEGKDLYAYRTKIIDIDGGERRTTIVHYDPNGDETSRELDPDDTFDPRTRPWYELAEPTSGESAVWTDPYVFFSSQKPGVTAALPVHEDYDDPSSTLLGVVGVDVELTRLSSDLRDNVDVSEHGTALLTDREGSVIATRDPNNVIRDDGTGGFRRARIGEIDDPVAAAAWSAGSSSIDGIPPGQSATVAFTSDGDAYRAVFTPLDNHRSWYAVVIGSEQDYLGEIQRAQRLNAIIAVGVGLAIVVLALPLLRYLANRGERLQQRANTDVLTGLANRRHFEDVLARQIERHRDRGRPVTVAMLDLDHFKGINDTYGHGIGDQALISVGRHLTAAVREDDLVARLGGDEFAVLLIGAPLDQAALILDRARATIEASPLTSGGQRVEIRITAGVADLIPGVTDGAALLHRADQALYVAKERGRNQVATIRDVDPAEAATTEPSRPVTTGSSAPARAPSGAPVPPPTSSGP